MKTLITVKGPVTSFNIQGSGVTFKSNPGSITFVVSGTGPQGPQGVPGTPAPTRKFAKFTGHIDQLHLSQNLSYEQDFNNTGQDFDLQWYPDSNAAIRIICTTDDDFFVGGKYKLDIIYPGGLNGEYAAPAIFVAYDDENALIIKNYIPEIGKDIYILIEDLHAIFT